MITLCAAFLQNARSSFQKALKGRVGPIGAVFSRFGFGLPFALIWLTVVSFAVEPPPGPIWGVTWTFGFYTVLGALSQIAATVALLASFNYANFAVGTAFSKTEPVQAALLGALLLGEVPTLMVVAAIAVGVLGVLVATLQPEGRLNAKAAAWGLGSAALFGISAVSFRAASLGLDDGGVWIRAATTLSAATLLQAVLMGAWMAWRTPDELRRTLAAWAPGAGAGAAGAFASACWFTAMTLEPVAHVRALGQVEIIFTFAASIFVFGERPARREVIGVGLMILGVAMLLLATA
ncbi:MAG: DMT family transporter [Rhodobacteraceae bacterium]|nr:DMT family transporter [Paracoccaceae bacterium]